MNVDSPRLRRPPIEPWRPAHVPKLHDDAYLDRFVDAALRVRERALHILETYQPEPLDEDKAAELRRILVAADAELKS